MAIIQFGEYKEGIPFKVLDEREIRASAGIMLFLGTLATINAFIFERYIVVTYLSGFLALNFMIGLFIHARWSPTMLLARLATYKQSQLPIGAVQKRFAWSLGLGLAVIIFILSFFLLSDVTYFEPVCMLCLLCLFLLFFETAFGICIGCKLFDLFIWLKIIPKPEIRPNCVGDSCNYEPNAR
jgi:hypothetical protein